MLLKYLLSLFINCFVNNEYSFFKKYISNKKYYCFILKNIYFSLICSKKKSGIIFLFLFMFLFLFR